MERTEEEFKTGTAYYETQNQLMTNHLIQTTTKSQNHDHSQREKFSLSTLKKHVGT